MDILERLRSSREWLNGGECCGDKDSEGICAAPACIFGEALKELYAAAEEIERLRETLRIIAEECESDYPSSYGAIKYAARAALGEKQ
jgi:hypothetical protein